MLLKVTKLGAKVWKLKPTFAIRWTMKINRGEFQLLLYPSPVLVVQRLGSSCLETWEWFVLPLLPSGPISGSFIQTAWLELELEGRLVWRFIRHTGPEVLQRRKDKGHNASQISGKWYCLKRAADLTRLTCSLASDLKRTYLPLCFLSCPLVSLFCWSFFDTVTHILLQKYEVTWQGLFCPGTPRASN